jgi:eukaryotic-like serine/threonine-protein kinase
MTGRARLSSQKFTFDDLGPSVSAVRRDTALQAGQYPVRPELATVAIATQIRTTTPSRTDCREHAWLCRRREMGCRISWIDHEYCRGQPPRRVRDRSGKELAVVGDAANYQMARISPDGSSVAVQIADGATETSGIWIKGLARETSTRLTFGQRSETTPVWSPDGLRLAYGSNRLGSLDIYQKALDGTGKDEPLLTGDGDQRPVNWSRDGRFISYDVTTDGLQYDVWVLPTFGDRKPFPFVQTPFNECCGHFSPDGRWLAYHSDESGRRQVYVKPFPGPGPSIQISTAGGQRPRWSAEGKELFYQQDRKIMSIEVTRGTRFDKQPLRLLFETDAPIATWDVAADGQRFLLATSRRADAFPPMTVVVNWPTIVQQR